MTDPAVLRIIDANFNRAREALRVAEDYARFALDAPRLTEELKGLRHGLREAVQALGPSAAELLAARDTAGDVGTPLATEAELQRADAAAVAQAAFKRLPEALRCLEEYGKTLNAGAARAIEDLRYRGYELELQMFRLPRKRLEDAVLYLVLDRAEATQEELLDLARGALEGGADMVQLRQKEAEGGELLDLAKALREMTREREALLIVNDRADIARLADADGVHLGRDDLPIRAGRRLLGPDKIIGATANTVEDATAAEAAGADYIGCGAMRPSVTKPSRPVVGPQRWAEVRQAVRIPVFAIGGVDLARLDELRAAGVDRVAVSHAIVGAEDACAAARAVRQELERPADA